MQAKFGDAFLPALTQAVLSRLQQSAQMKAAGDANWWRLREAAHIALGSAAVELSPQTFDMNAYLPLLAEEIEDADEVGGARLVDDIGGADAVRGHAHVERPVPLEGEAALGLVDLHRGNAEIERHAIDRAAERPRTEAQRIGAVFAVAACVTPAALGLFFWHLFCLAAFVTA